MELKNNLSYYLNRLKIELLKKLSLVTNIVFNKPYFIGLQIEDRCFLKCQHCDLWKTQPLKNKLNLSQQKKIIKKLKDWLGEIHLSFDGGEPFINKQIFQLTTHASKLRIKVKINTNGVLIDENMIVKIIKSDIFCINFSLDAIDTSLHDKLRGVKGVFEKATRAIEILNNKRCQEKSKLILTINCVIMEPNLSQIEKLTYWVKNKGLDGISFQPIEENFGKPSPDLYWYKKTNLWPRYRDVEKVIDKIIYLKKKGYPIINSVSQLKTFKEYFYNPRKFSRAYGCGVGLSNFTIDLAGNIRLCYALRPIGNVFEASLSEIWKSKEANIQRKVIKNCKRSCRVLLCNQENFLKDIIEKFYFKFIRGV